MVGVVGIFLSVVTIASHRAHTQAVIHRTESNDEWAYYQAKKIREYTSEVAVDPAAEPGRGSRQGRRRPSRSSRRPATNTRRMRRRSRKTPRRKDDETDIEESRALRFDIGEGLLELGLVLCSLYFLARNGFFPDLRRARRRRRHRAGHLGLAALSEADRARGCARCAALAARRASRRAPAAARRAGAGAAGRSAIGRSARGRAGARRIE